VVDALKSLGVPASDVDCCEVTDDESGFWISAGERWTAEETEPIAADCRLVLSDAREYEGDEGEGMGNVAAFLGGFGGEIIGSFVPYNFTDQVWCSFDKAGRRELAKRLSRFDALSIAAEVVDWLAERGYPPLQEPA
jgi:hypothetical protein